mmetsp:Transcript_44267/g.101118  ORF Transcript_44267/g.101118 Transcript_44267/m.101118 type:complete len:290 (+) Transcript_44267:1-870(+)
MVGVAARWAQEGRVQPQGVEVVQLPQLLGEAGIPAGFDMGPMKNGKVSVAVKETMSTGRSIQRRSQRILSEFTQTTAHAMEVLPHIHHALTDGSAEVAVEMLELTGAWVEGMKKEAGRTRVEYQSFARQLDAVTQVLQEEKGRQDATTKDAGLALASVPVQELPALPPGEAWAKLDQLLALPEGDKVHSTSLAERKPQLIAALAHARRVLAVVERCGMLWNSLEASMTKLAKLREHAVVLANKAAAAPRLQSRLMDHLSDYRAVWEELEAMCTSFARAMEAAESSPRAS